MPLKSTKLNKSTHTKSPKSRHRSFRPAGLTGLGSRSQAHEGHLYERAAETASSEPPLSLMARERARGPGWPRFECKQGLDGKQELVASGRLVQNIVLKSVPRMLDDGSSGTRRKETCNQALDDERSVSLGALCLAPGGSLMQRVCAWSRAPITEQRRVSRARTLHAPGFLQWNTVA